MQPEPIPTVILNAIKRKSRERSHRGRWDDEHIKGEIVDGETDESIFKIGSEADAAFIALADSYMEELVDEVFRLRNIVYTVGIATGLKRENLTTLLDGE